MQFLFLSWFHLTAENVKAKGGFTNAFDVAGQIPNQICRGKTPLNPKQAPRLVMRALCEASRLNPFALSCAD
jgi:hypothetical protein